jgi:hypothetical protein
VEKATCQPQCQGEQPVHDKGLHELVQKENQYNLNVIDLIAAFNAPTRDVVKGETAVEVTR